MTLALGAQHFVQTGPHAACPRVRAGAGQKEPPHAHTRAVCGRFAPSGARAGASGCAIAPAMTDASSRMSPLAKTAPLMPKGCASLGPSGRTRPPPASRLACASATSRHGLLGEGPQARRGLDRDFWGDERALAGRRPGFKQRTLRRAPRRNWHPTHPQGPARPCPPAATLPHPAARSRRHAPRQAPTRLRSEARRPAGPSRPERAASRPGAAGS